ncbi:MAG TPA: TIGR04552 family protein, partial [Polyangiaceae bacterium]|nr:TIGR04552 family protein [Polyangiaceae bacterium]
LLSKQETVAAAIYDKLRFRIVTSEAADLLPVLQYLTQRLFPFNYVLPGQSINTLVPFRTFCEGDPHLRALLGELQGPTFTDLTPTDNGFSASNYRVMHFVVDMPVRVPQVLLDRCPPGALPLGPVIFMLCEFQLLDRTTESLNEEGDASHARYKQRQREAVARRLKLGTRELRLPPNSARKASADGTPIPGMVDGVSVPGAADGVSVPGAVDGVSVPGAADGASLRGRQGDGASARGAASDGASTRGAASDGASARGAAGEGASGVEAASEGPAAREAAGGEWARGRPGG